MMKKKMKKKKTRNETFYSYSPLKRTVSLVVNCNVHPNAPGAQLLPQPEPGESLMN